MSEVEEGGLGESEEMEGLGVALEELDLRTCTDDGVESEDLDVSFSKHNT